MAATAAHVAGAASDPLSPSPRPARAARPTRRPARRRAAAASVLVAGVIAAAVAVATDAAVGQPPGVVGADAVATVVIAEDETAWEALRPYVPAGVDHAVFVHEVLRANDVDARALRPGDVVVVPGHAGR